MMDAREETKLVLLVEDNPGDIALVRETFTECQVGARLVPCESVPRAIACLSRLDSARTRRLPDLIILDLNMPLVDGWDLLQMLDSEPRWNHIRVLVLSSSTRAADRERCEARGAEYEVKPDTWQGFVALGRRLKARLDNRGRARRASRRPRSALSASERL